MEIRCPSNFGDLPKKILHTQARYKKNDDNRLRRDKKIIKPDDYVFIRVERRDDKKSIHELAPIAEGPYLVKDVETAIKAVVIERDERSQENVSRSSVTLTPMIPRSAEELLEETCLQTEDDLGTELPVSEDSNMNQLITSRKKTSTKQTDVKGQQSDSDEEQKEDN